MAKKIIPVLLIIWLLLVLVPFYVVQKPEFLNITSGLKNFLLTILIPAWMLLLSVGIGTRFMPESNGIERLILSAAIGMAIIGLLGFGLAISGWATPLILTSLMAALTIYFLYSGRLKQIWADVNYLSDELRSSTQNTQVWIPISTGIALGLAFLMGLAPPIEDFDALLYHLTVPAWWLRDNAIILSTSVGYWVPHTVEGSFIFPLVFGVDSAAHLIHLIWLMLSMLLIWHWARQVANNIIAWDTIAIILTMPSLLLLASWAYNDFTLVFTGTAVIYSLWRWQDTGNDHWAVVGGIMAGIAMGAKYQSFFMPVIGGILILLWGRGPLQKRIKSILFFGFSAFLFSFIWYARNWIWTGNPIYPFVFGGKQWDSFLTSVQPGTPGSGIGYDLKQLLLLPFTATLGIKDVSYFDSRFGPFFLILFPIAAWTFLKYKSETQTQQRAFFAIGLLSLIGVISWVTGVINIDSLFQSRYLFPSLIPLTLPLAVGLNALANIDTPQLKTSFIFRSLLAIVVISNLFNFSLFVILRNPLGIALGMTSRQQYMENVQPGYARALKLVDTLPETSKVYFLFEPRSYGMKPFVEPDSLLVNLEHSLWLHGSDKTVFASWKTEGYTHVLISKIGAEYKLNDKPELRAQLGQIESQLISIGETENGEYELFEIP